MIAIRKAAKQDISEILKIYSPYIVNTAISFEYEVPSLDVFTLRYEKITKQFPWLVCEIDGVLSGYAYASFAFERAAYQWSADISVYIDKKHHRKGIATAFYRCIEQFLVMQGYYNLYAVITGTNEKSLSFHRSLGYSELAVFHHSGYKLSEWHDVMWYEKNLREFTDDPKPPIAFSILDESQIDAILLDYTQKVNQRFCT